MAPKDKVFTTDAGKTVVAFLDKRENFQVLNIGSKAREGGTTEKLPFSVVKEIYDKVERPLPRMTNGLSACLITPPCTARLSKPYDGSWTTLTL